MLDLSTRQASGTRRGSLLEGQGEPGMGQTVDCRPAGEGHLPRLPWMSGGHLWKGGSVCRWGDVSYGAEAMGPLIKAGGSPPYPQIGWDEDAEAQTDRADSGLHPGGPCLRCPALRPSTNGVAGGGRLQGQEGHREQGHPAQLAGEKPGSGGLGVGEGQGGEWGRGWAWWGHPLNLEVATRCPVWHALLHSGLEWSE